MIKEVFIKRRSIRKYLSVPVEKEKWTQILQLASLSPSSGNLQPWKVIVIDNQEQKDKIAQISHNQQFLADAPILFVICVDTKIVKQHYGARGEMLYATQDCAAFTQSVLLAATDMDLGTCWVSAFEEDRLKHFLSIPPHIRPQAIVSLGYPDEKPPTPPKNVVADCVFFNSYGNRADEFGNAMRTWDFSTGRQIMKKNMVGTYTDVKNALKKRLSKK